MTGFNYFMLGLAGVAVLLFVLLCFMLARRTRGRGGFEPPDPRPVPQPTASPAPVPAFAPSITPVAPVEHRPYGAWRLIERSLANPDSAGGPLYRLRLVPEATLPKWRAGAVARLYCGPAQDVLAPAGPPLATAGEYMVGSLPEDGWVDLVVRQRSEGQDEGGRSQWLCQEVQTGQQVALSLRDDPDFAPPPDDVPLILIGNATGLAGLQAHIRARPPGTRNWLIFGDRNTAEDQVLATEVADWVSTGHLERCDLVFPGDGHEQRRVTDQIEDARAPLLDWALAGAALYICGSQRMGDDVHAALCRILGGEVVEVLASAGLYRRALY